MPKYEVLRGKVLKDGTTYTSGEMVELDEEVAGRFPSRFLKFMPDECTVETVVDEPIETAVEEPTEEETKVDFSDVVSAKPVRKAAKR